MKFLLTFFLIATLVHSMLCDASEAQLAKKRERQKRLFSVFSVVTWKNDACVTKSDTSMRGTCMSSTDCSSKSGTADGNCASGFGVCCMFTLSACSSTVNQNCTYIQNAEYPATAAVSTTCSYTFNRICDDLCQIRLDFVNLVTAGPLTKGTDTVGLCSTSGDTVTVTSPTSPSISGPPVICGTNTGQHMYLETGQTGTAGSIAFVFGPTTATRTYKIKVSYIQCSSRSKAPSGCTKYYTGVSGTDTSFNFGNQFLALQQYSTCFRQEKGYCSIEYSATPGVTNNFDLYGNIANMPDAKTEVTCPMTYVAVPMAGPGSAATSRICGGTFSDTDEGIVDSAVTSTVLPFTYETYGNGELGEDATTDQFDGYSLDFRQVPCTT